MPIDFLCSKCGAKIRCPDEAAGQKVKCPHCESLSTVPGRAVPVASDVAHLSSPEKTSGTGETSNPFQAPVETSYSSSHQRMAALGNTFTRAHALARLKLPSLALIVCATLNILVYVGVSCWISFVLSEDENFIAGVTLYGITTLVIILWNGVVIFGACQMKKARRFPLAILACVMALIGFFQTFPCCCPISLLQVPFAIWGLVVLSDKYIHNQFSAEDDDQDSY